MEGFIFSQQDQIIALIMIFCMMIIGLVFAWEISRSEDIQNG